MNRRVMMVGSARQSGGGVASVIRTMTAMPFWKRRSCYWLGTQIQRNYLWKLWYALRSAVVAPFIMPRYGIIHFHTTPNSLGLLIQMPELLYAKLLRKKVVVQVHMGNQLVNYTNNRLFKWVLRRADLVLLLARRWQKLYEESYSDVGTPSDVLYNAAPDVPTVSPDEKTKTILMAAYLCENKGVDVLLKAWKRLQPSHPDWSVVIMGNGEVERYKRLAADMGLAGSVRFAGYLTGGERERQWREASVYCMCSYEEGFPMVALEAWMYGAALVTTPVGGLPDVIEDGRNCLVFPFGDSDALADRLQQLIGKEPLRQRLTSYSRPFAASLFSISKINDDVERIYSRLTAPE